MGKSCQSDNTLKIMKKYSPIWSKNDKKFIKNKKPVMKCLTYLIQRSISDIGCIKNKDF